MADSARSHKSGSSKATLVVGQLGLILAAVAALLSIVGARRTSWQEVDGYGLISALPSLYWLGIFVGFLATLLLLLGAQRQEVRYGSVVPALWLLLLHTAPQMAHEHARFSIVYTHIGFVRLIDEISAGDVLFDARFAWPGFFGAFIAPLADLPEPLLDLFMRLWPSYITGGTAVLVAALARRAYPTIPLIGTYSSMVYVLLAWTGQDYFSPQSVGYLFYVAMLVIIESGPLRPGMAGVSTVPLMTKFATAGGDRIAPRELPSFVSLIVLSLAAVVSHPLAPFFICMGLLILALYGRRVAWRLLFIVGTAYVFWFVISAEPWWSSRVDQLIEQFGNILGNLGNTTGNRVHSSDRYHRLLVNLRTITGFVTFAFVLIIGIVMSTQRYRYLRPGIPLAPLAGIPVLAVFVQSYGGEIIIRVLLFSLPMAAILVGRMLSSLPTVASRTAAVSLLSLILCPLLLLCRYGNERFEMTSGPDRAAVEAAYAAAEEPTLLASENSFINWRDKWLHVHYFYELPEKFGDTWNDCRFERLEKIRSDRELTNVFMVLTNSQNAWNEHGESLGPNTMADSADTLLARPGSELVYQGEGTWVISIDTTTGVPDNPTNSEGVPCGEIP